MTVIAYRVTEQKVTNRVKNLVFLLHSNTRKTLKIELKSNYNVDYEPKEKKSNKCISLC